MKIVCKNCKTVNVIGSLFCRGCGVTFDFIQRWESYDFQPTSVYSPRVGIRILYEFVKCIMVIFLLIFLVPISFALEYFIHKYTSIELDEFQEKLCVTFMIIVFILIVLITLKRTINNWKKHKVYLRRNADYIQSNISSFQRYRFFLKNNKMGLVDVKRFKVTIPAKYDVLQWRYTDKIVDASIEGERLVLDVRGNILE